MRIVVKIGTRSLLNKDDTLDLGRIETMAAQIYALSQKGYDTVLVSSGAVGAGRGLWQNLPHKEGKDVDKDKVLEKQFLASIGQAALIHHYNDALRHFDMVASQLLMTRYDFRHRRHSVNVGRLLDKLLTQPQVLPIVNENDSLAVEELMFTDNDELAGLVAAQIGAQALVILTDVPGVLADPSDPKSVIAEISAGSKLEDHNLSGKGGGRGGMLSKLKTARKAAKGGVATYIVPAREKDILLRVVDGEQIGTRIAPEKKKSSIKRWLATGVQQKRGRIVVNGPLAQKLTARKDVLSILPVGITEIQAPFMKGDVVEIESESGVCLGHGLCKYDSEILEGYLGRQNQPVFIHYNELHVYEDAE